MSRMILLEFSCSDLGLFKLDLSAAARSSCDLYDAEAIATAEALCVAVNAGVADEAVFQALNARSGDFAAPPAAGGRRAAG